MTDTRIDPIVEQINKRRDLVFDALARESDRGVILVGIAFLDEALEALIRAKFQDKARKIKAMTKDLFGAIGPLRSFWAKTRLAYALDLIAACEYRDLELLRAIRNRFAHRIEAVGFDDAEVIRLAEQLVSVELWAKHRNEQQQDTAIESSESQDSVGSMAKGTLARVRIHASIGWISARIFCNTLLLETVPAADAEKMLKRNTLLYKSS